ncbi:hypothetical protein I0C86_38380 [Plantactinospora sp. S1510]|uniref:Uncharacterized protein n=1 Tax=Plantactinospora alkalitolerans TaxID=2789879 RepID=A0ABS0H8F8_9ACTN|nr:hypothetical protein [Plantactinospora alkalitolerans]MBF9134755.1 hypothetical protein [Plantactinospora alkalitolerans]
MASATLAATTFASEPAATADRIQQLTSYMGEHVLDRPTGCRDRELREPLPSAAHLGGPELRMWGS